ncbi:LOW QUALITY PROTEIN: hypothetical protein PanWU01x14_261220 [Parasponia andersonii]|uniref:Uncharacterized protein n=1 Tax=Parasponia andersonii TaxID=3476 RepID=A0A2P5B8R0_PARAD|nr:LOW QUALITY PROTEIN: hypothetical protein PanWU01x14_261220 [Parasponia andersonii]
MVPVKRLLLASNTTKFLQADTPVGILPVNLLSLISSRERFLAVFSGSTPVNELWLSIKIVERCPQTTGKIPRKPVVFNFDHEQWAAVSKSLRQFTGEIVVRSHHSYQVTPITKVFRLKSTKAGNLPIPSGISPDN